MQNDNALPGKWVNRGVCIATLLSAGAHYRHTRAAGSRIQRGFEGVPLIGKSVRPSPEFPKTGRRLIIRHDPFRQLKHGRHNLSAKEACTGQLYSCPKIPSPLSGNRSPASHGTKGLSPAMNSLTFDSRRHRQPLIRLSLFDSAVKRWRFY